MLDSNTFMLIILGAIALIGIVLGAIANKYLRSKHSTEELTLFKLRAQLVVEAVKQLAKGMGWTKETMFKEAAKRFIAFFPEGKCPLNELQIQTILEACVLESKHWWEQLGKPGPTGPTGATGSK